MIPTLAQDRSAIRAGGADPLARLARSDALAALALVALALVAVSPTLFSPFFADDYLHVEVAAHWVEALRKGWILPVDQAGSWWTPHGLSVEYFRPVVVLSFAFDRFLYGAHAAGYHFTNFALHGATTLLVWGIARRVLGVGFGAWMAAALFAVHPAHTVAIGWISGRTDVLATVFYAAAFLAHLESREASRGPAARAGFVALACVALATALFTKEMAITLPAVVFAHNLLDARGESLARRLVTPVLLGLVAVGYFAIRVGVLGGFHPPPQPFAFHFGDPGLFAHLVTAPFLYLADLVLFVPADPMATLPFWKAHPFLLVGFIGLVVATFRTTLARAEHGATIPGRRIAVWGLGWMVVTILPVMMLTVGEHFLYLPSIGYSILVGAQKPKGWGVDAKELRSTAIVLGIVGVVCFARTAMFWGLSRSSARAIDETAAALDRAPQASRVFVADLPASAALAFPQAVRIERPGRSAGVEILSVVPRVFPDTGDLSQVTFAAPDRLEMRRENGYLTSYLERALEGPPHPYHVGQTFERDGYSVTITDAPDGGVRAFSVQLRDPEHTLILVRGEGGLETLPPPASR